MQQGIKKLQWYEYLKLVFLEILNPLLCWVFANQVTYIIVWVSPYSAFATYIDNYSRLHAHYPTTFKAVLSS